MDAYKHRASMQDQLPVNTMYQPTGQQFGDCLVGHAQFYCDTKKKNKNKKQNKTKQKHIAKNYHPLSLCIFSLAAGKGKVLG